MGRRANSAFATAVILLPFAALGFALTVATVPQHTFVHVMAGVLWTGIDLFMGTVLGPVIGGLDDEQSAALFSRLTPKTAFLLPSLAVVTIAGGITLAQRLGYFDDAGGWLALFTAVNVVSVLLLFGWRLKIRDDRRWQVALAVGGVSALAWVATSLGEFGALHPAIAVAPVLVTVLTVQGSASC